MGRTFVFVTVALAASACTEAIQEGPVERLSVLGHENSAAIHDAQARQEAALFNPAAEKERQHCAPGRGDTSLRACWTSTVNPTIEHKRRAAAFRALANDHRAAAQALREAESAACVDVATIDRNHSPFEHTDDILGASDLVSDQGALQGASITLRAVPGLTKRYLEQVVQCQLARDAATGFAEPERAFCPLNVDGASASVQSVPGGFRVDVLAHDPNAAAEISRRAKVLSEMARPSVQPPEEGSGI